MIRSGALHSRWPATFPSGQGSDLAGLVAETGPGVDGWRAGDEVIGFVDTHSSQAQFTIVEAANLTRRPSEMSWEKGGALFVAGATA